MVYVIDFHIGSRGLNVQSVCGAEAGACEIDLLTAYPSPFVMASRNHVALSISSASSGGPGI